ncbi:MAG: hypothetical protein AAF533_12125 [Acidobacteriota bacterium]
MTTTLRTLVVTLVALGLAGNAAAFDSGSDESFGDITLAVDEQLQLAVPPDGVFHCTTVTLATGADLTFLKNDLNTPVTILATGDIVVNSGATINVTGGTSSGANPGIGGPGGFDGGAAGGSGVEAGDGKGPGGGKSGDSGTVGRGVFGCEAFNPRDNDGDFYGNPLLLNMIGGSGGAGRDDTFGGGGGGGAILLASNTRIQVIWSGGIYAEGGGSSGAEGSGGAIRLVAPIVEGNGFIYARGGESGTGGGGRIRIDTLDGSGITFGSQPPCAVSIGSIMRVSSPQTGRLDITDVGGTAIVVGTTSAVLVDLPPGSSENQTVTVQATDFTGMVPIQVALTPEKGSRTTFDATIDMSGGSPASVVVPVVIPANVPVEINVWTR